jgi:hypothetical protein
VQPRYLMAGALAAIALAMYHFTGLSREADFGWFCGARPQMLDKPRNIALEHSKVVTQGGEIGTTVDKCAHDAVSPIAAIVQAAAKHRFWRMESAKRRLGKYSDRG